mmetsp:Transcript_57018/g.135639  ORF Transcript_57018/g.135639 Transcript_57018/m.135639 type:complete len:213 (-) Transcript_57018:607-1245(-)
MLQDCMHNMVSEGMCCKLCNALRQLLKKLCNAWRGGKLLSQSAHDAAAKTVFAGINSNASQLLRDEARNLNRHHLHNLLQHVVGMRGSHGFPHVAVQLPDDLASLGALRLLDSLLHQPASLDVCREPPNGPLELLDGSDARGTSCLQLTCELTLPHQHHLRLSLHLLVLLRQGLALRRWRARLTAAARRGSGTAVGARHRALLFHHEWLSVH